MSNVCESGDCTRAPEGNDCTRAPTVYVKYEGPSWWHHGWHHSSKNRIQGKTANFHTLYGSGDHILAFHLCRVCADSFLVSSHYRLINKEEHDVIKVMNS
jgi:hypothetical protein